MFTFIDPCIFLISLVGFITLAVSLHIPFHFVVSFTKCLCICAMSDLNKLILKTEGKCNIFEYPLKVSLYFENAQRERTKADLINIHTAIFRAFLMALLL